MANPATVATALTSQSLPTPSNIWLTNLLSTQRPSTPLPSIVATARLRLLASDLTTPTLLASNTSSLPLNLSHPDVKSMRLGQDIVVQILGIEDMSRSRWEQIESIEAVERGEMVRGREIIRVVAEEDNENGLGSSASTQHQRPVTGQSTNTNAGPHKLVLQDWKGQRVFGIELKNVHKLGLDMEIGTKVVLKKGIEVARGMVLLEPSKVVVLGGKVDALHKTWLGGRKQELREGIEANRNEHDE